VLIAAALLAIRSCGADPPNVLLITVDTLRADHLASYGHPQVRTPAFDRLGAEGVRFTRAYSASNATLPLLM
jgi:arylsulfatase A-like enzyme